MSRKQDQVTDNAPFGKYFHVMLNMADDDLNPYQYRLLGHYRRVCGDNGACWESTRTTAKKCKMSTGKVSSTRKELETTGYIHLQYRDDDTCFITLVDRMAENIQRYCSPHEQPVHHMNGSVHQVKQRITNEEKPNKKDIAPGGAKSTAKKERARDLYVDAITQAFGYNPPTKAELKKAGIAAAQLKEAGYTVEDIPLIYAYCKRQGWNEFTPLALPNHAGNWKRTAKPAPANKAESAAAPNMREMVGG